jgi:hypothetical protein
MPELFSSNDIDIKRLSMEQPENDKRPFDVRDELTLERWQKLHDRTVASMELNEVYNFFHMASILDEFPNPGASQDSQHINVNATKWNDLEYAFKSQLRNDESSQEYPLFRSMTALHHIASTYPEEFERFKALISPDTMARYTKIMGEKKLSNDEIVIYHLMAYHLRLTDGVGDASAADPALLNRLLENIDLNYRLQGKLMNSSGVDSFARYSVAAKALYSNFFPNDYLTNEDWRVLKAWLDFDWEANNFGRYAELLSNMNLLSHKKLVIVDHRVVPVKTEHQVESGLRPLPDMRDF